MLSASFINKNLNEVLLGLDIRQFQKIYLIDEILILYKKKKKLEIIINNILTKEKILSNKIRILIQQQKNENITQYEEKKIMLFKEISIKYKKQKNTLLIDLHNILKNLENKLDQIPNIPDQCVQKIEEKIIFKKNIIYSQTKCKILSHWELSKKFSLFDLSLGSKISGSSFAVYIGQGAKLYRSLIQYFLDQNILASYVEYNLPYIVNKKSVYSTGQLPDKEGQMYVIEKDNFYLIPTGEVPLINCYRNNLFSYKDLPIKNTTHTSCFRRESGSYGSKVRGLNRLHQFDKVEIIQITTSERSCNSLKEMIEHVKKLIISLELPFRMIRLIGKNLGFSSAITYDFEVYSRAQDKWLEVSSISNCKNFQSNRLNLKYRNRHGKIEFCHTLNGSALALPRIMAALLENHQTSTKIKIPKILIPYTGFNNIE
ncbi:serine--tRNA ligase [Blattabacterium cuenoti]|uniref:serine--tRNA ligase n=1 Tax=Blattabacterium cuenoti TaxID=1653831 RepID=UPI00163BE990|nr:serine--tRNA ligase [Blattabacterium cuenoti]